MAVHFVYAVPDVGVLRGKRDGVDTSGFPGHSPFCITHYLYQALRKRTTTYLYHYLELGVIAGGKGDVLVGHPVMEGPKAAWNMSAVHGGFGVKVAMLPLHHGYAEVNAHLDPFVAGLDGILAVTGKYWFDTLGKSPFAHWADKVTRVDMAVDVAKYPRVKKKFNAPGKRKFLFIGNSSNVKGTHLLSILFGLAEREGLGHKCVWIGSDGRWGNLEHRPPTALTPEYMASVAEECDVFLTVGVSDANPTTILESMAWGFPVGCTPQSGYYGMPTIWELSTTDMRKNLGVLEEIQRAPEEELRRRAGVNRKMVEEEYTWERFGGTVIGALEKMAAGKGVEL